MPQQQLKLRKADQRDVDNVAVVSRTSRMHFLPYLPHLHSLEEDKNYFRRRVFPKSQVWVFEEKQKIVGFCAFRSGWIDHLYLLPTHVGMSLGKALVNKAKEHHSVLHLMVFQRNVRAISFYERNGFKKIKETDGSNCEEKMPDALYEWRK